MKPILLVSGGIDSFIANAYLTHVLGNINTLYIDYGGKYCEKEKEVVKYLHPKTIFVEDKFNFKNDEEGENAFISFRNLYLTTYATKYSDQIFIGGLKDDNVGDKSPDFFSKLGATLSHAKGRTIEICSPFRRKEKIEVIDWYLRQFGYVNGAKQLSLTTSCYHETEKYCGECPSCFRKFCSFAYHGIPCSFSNMDLVKKYEERAIAGEFPSVRTKSILQVTEQLRGDGFI